MAESFWSTLGQFLGRSKCKKRTGRVRFTPSVRVLEFDRMLFGGGGVPDQDSVSLGLGHRLVTDSKADLVEKETKDEYACTGFVEEHKRTELLTQWASEAKLRTQLNTVVSPQIKKTQRERSESAACRKDQRRMPVSESEALEIALRDAAVARRVASQHSSINMNSPAASVDRHLASRGSRTPKGAGSISSGRKAATRTTSRRTGGVLTRSSARVEGGKLEKGARRRRRGKT